MERRLAGPMTLADIEWIWDEYVAHTEYGPKYDRYRPTRDDYFPHAEEGCFGFPVD